MSAKARYTLWSFILCLLFNGVLTAGLYVAAREVLSGAALWLNPLVAGKAGEVPEGAMLALTNLQGYLGQVDQYLLYVVAGAGGGVTLLLWLLLVGLGRGQIGRAQKRAAAARPATKPKPEKKEQPKPVVTAEQSPGPAAQMLSILQRKGRFVDFLQEDLSLYQDDQIGAAVRSIHEGCQDAIREHVQLKPIFEEEEGTQVSVPEGFDARAVRLTGGVTGSPPFSGTLQHRGWRVTGIKLPKVTTEKENDWIIAPAEVEVS